MGSAIRPYLGALPFTASSPPRDTMGNDLSHQPYVVRQISQASGKDEDSIRGYYSAFQKECPSGHLTPEDFSNLYAKVFGSGEAQEMRSKAFGAFSKNGNSIDFRDFVMVIHLTSNGSADEKLRLMFRMYDTDGNGSIDKAEMNKVIQECYQMLQQDSHGQAQDMFNMMDKDGDGKITEQEFVRSCLEDVELSRLLSMK